MDAALYFFKVEFSTFWLKFGATLRRQAERRDSGTRQKTSNPVSYTHLTLPTNREV